MSAKILIYILDLIGCTACAATGSLLAKRAGMDWVGGIVISVVAAIGGGTVRDLLIARHPIFWLHDLAYLEVIASTSIIVRIFYYKVEAFIDRPLRLFDTVGLAAFAVIGFEAALSKNLSFPIMVMMGMITSSVGGMIRDVLCNQVPLVLRKEIYVLWVVLGGVVYEVMLQLGVGVFERNLLTMLVIFTMRMLTIYRNWDVVDITLRPAKKKGAEQED